MKPAIVIDTNVPMVANGMHEEAGLQCELACIKALLHARNQLVLLDDRQEILLEYRRNLKPSGQPGVGDAFFKWLWNNHTNPKCCRIIKIETMDGSYVDFPDDPDLAGFDLNDRKFVAVALASKLDPEILNASDTDWWIHRESLERNRVRIRFLCPQLMNSQEE
jgi:hypothetical protein